MSTFMSVVFVSIADAYRLYGYQIRISNTTGSRPTVCYIEPGDIASDIVNVTNCTQPSRYVELYRDVNNPGAKDVATNSIVLNLCELQVFGMYSPEHWPYFTLR